MVFNKDPHGFYIETIHNEYTYTDPVFFDTTGFSWCKELESKTPEIINCLQSVLADDFAGLITNPEDRFQFPPKIWKGFPFYFNGFKFKKHLEEYLFLAEELKKIPNLISAAVSVLEPGAHLLPHNGNSNGVMRYHLGLNIPAQMPDCGFIIGGKEVSWEVGKSFMFCNMNVHSAHNKTNKRRHILMLDVVRPEFTAIKKKICVHTLAMILTNDTANAIRKLLRMEQQKAEQDPEHQMEYVDNKFEIKRREDVPVILRLLRLGEKMIMYIYILFLYFIFLFKKLQ